jgi:predicted membrane metal-binding protein
MGRRADPITALLLASALMLLARPEFADSAGFWLSMAASAAMVTCIDRRPSGHGSLVLGGVVALVAAQVATLPVTLAVFGAWSPASLVANLIVGPIVSAFFPFAFAVGLLVTLLPWVGDLIGWLPAIVADVVIAIVRSLADAFPVVRVGAVPRVALALVAALSLAVIATMSADMRRWLRRAAWRAPAAAAFGPAVAVGAGLGAWLVVLAVATWR